jgi:hypothetical protein
MFTLFHHLKTCIKNFFYLFPFSPSHLFRNIDATCEPHKYIYAPEADFFQVVKNYQVFCQYVGGVFLASPAV